MRPSRPSNRAGVEVAIRQRFGERQAERVDDVAHGVEQRDHAAGERVEVVDQARSVAPHAPPLQGEDRRSARRRRHRVGGQRDSPCPLGVDRRAQRRRMDVMAVGDQAADDRRIGERRADQAGRARAELAHRVEEMGDRARAGGEGGARLLRRRLGVAEADDDPRRGEAGDQRRTGGRRRQRDDHRAGLGGDELVAVAFPHRADEFRQMDALAARIDERPLDMDAEDARRRARRLARRRQRRDEHGRRVGDDGRQDRGDAGAAKRGGDRRQRLGRRRRVEQHAAAAVDLPVDEPRRQHAAGKIDLLAAARPLGRRRDARRPRRPRRRAAQSSRIASPSNRRAPKKTFNGPSLIARRLAAQAARRRR